jgi:hypothetical protein
MLVTNYTKRFKKIIHLTQKSQNKFTIKTAANKSKATWSVINEYQNTPKESIKKILFNDRILTHPYDIANTLNNYFIDQINTTSKITCNNTYDIKYQSNSHSIFMTPTNPHEVYKIILSLKNTNSVGYDGISTTVIKSSAEYLATPLSYIINISLSQGVFPDAFKLSIVRPIHKKGDVTNIKNYRPIALIPVLSKIFERVIYKTVYSFLEKYNILNPQQYGFRQGKSTNLAIFELLNLVTDSIDNRQNVCAIFMDLTKAFDYVDHGLLLHKLYHCGIRGVAYNLFESYLSNRVQQTAIKSISKQDLIIKEYLSKCRDVEYGVPQGTILGPLLFLLYINDMPKTIEYPMTLFADDSTILIKCKNNLTYENDITATLINIIKWLDMNNLNINIDKTKIMHFRQYTQTPNVNIRYGNEIIEQVTSTKFLGINLDHQTNWLKHTSDLCTRINKYVFALKRLTKISDTETAVTAYNGYVASILRYGIIFWGNCTNKLEVFKSQKKCIRAIRNLKRMDTCKPHFISLKILTVPSLYIFETAMFVRRNPHLFPTFSSLPTGRSRRHEHMLQSTTARTALKNKSFFCMAPQIYNKIPKKIKESNLTIFKKELFSLLVNKAYYTVVEFLYDKI